MVLELDDGVGFGFRLLIRPKDERETTEVKGHPLRYLKKGLTTLLVFCFWA